MFLFRVILPSFPQLHFFPLSTPSWFLPFTLISTLLSPVNCPCISAYPSFRFTAFLLSSSLLFVSRTPHGLYVLAALAIWSFSASPTQRVMENGEQTWRERCLHVYDTSICAVYYPAQGYDENRSKVVVTQEPALPIRPAGNRHKARSLAIPTTLSRVWKPTVPASQLLSPVFYEPS
jgi:hypothetical protein